MEGLCDYMKKCLFLHIAFGVNEKVVYRSATPQALTI